MKKVDAIIKPFELDAVKEALCCLGIRGMTITEVKVPVEQEGRSGVFKRAPIEFMPKLKIEVIVSDSNVDEAVEMIKRSGYVTSNNNILVSHIEDAIRIRTAQKGEDAIT